MSLYILNIQYFMLDIYYSMLNSGSYRLLILVSTLVQYLWVLSNVCFCIVLLIFYLIFCGFVQSALVATFVENGGFVS